MSSYSAIMTIFGLNKVEKEYVRDRSYLVRNESKKRIYKILVYLDCIICGDTNLVLQKVKDAWNYLINIGFYELYS